MNKEPCSICEEYIEGIVCDKDKCPVAQLKNNFEKALKTIDGLMAGQKTLIEESKSAKSEAINEFVNEYKDHIDSFTGMFSPELGFVVSLDAVLYAVDFISEKILGRNDE